MTHKWKHDYVLNIYTAWLCDTALIFDLYLSEFSSELYLPLKRKTLINVLYVELLDVD